MTSCLERAVSEHENGIHPSSSVVSIEPQSQDQATVENRENDKNSQLSVRHSLFWSLNLLFSQNNHLSNKKKDIFCHSTSNDLHL